MVHRISGCDGRGQGPSLVQNIERGFTERRVQLASMEIKNGQELILNFKRDTISCRGHQRVFACVSRPHNNPHYIGRQHGCSEKMNKLANVVA